MSINNLVFDYYDCNFSEQLMTQKDKASGASREGSGRVTIFKETNLTNCYTIECSYFSAKKYNILSPKLNLEKQQIEPETPSNEIMMKDGKVI